MIKNEQIKKLYQAIVAIKDVEECEKVLEDLFTIKELQDISQRLQVAKLLDKKEIYSDIVKETGASSATVSRVARCLNYGDGGYRLILDRIKEENDE